MDGIAKFGKLSSYHPKMEKIFKVLERAAPTNSTILILGESGTGKEITAKAVYENSKRSSNTFLTFNCAIGSKELIDSELFGHYKGAFTGALSDRKGLFENAHKGTLFLDEIGDMPFETQAKILRALEAKEITPVGSNKIIKIDVRIIAATNKDLKEEVIKGNFREDLYYRLGEIIVELPPLRERENDIPLLFEEMLKEFNEEYHKNITNLKISALGILQKHTWPGNIRELRNVLKRTIILLSESQTEIFAENLFENIRFINSHNEFVNNLTETPKEKEERKHFFLCKKCHIFKNNSSLSEVLENCEKEIIIEALQQTCGNKTKAALILKTDRITLYHKIKKYNIKPNWSSY